MRWRIFVARVRELFRLRRIDRELGEELETHLSLLEDEYVRRGLDRGEARRAARLDLGGLDQTKELVRDRRGFRPIETLAHDVRYAIRLLAKSPGFTVAAVVTLALGIGANAAIFSLVDAVMLRPLPYPEPRRLVSIWEVGYKSGARSVVAPANYVDYAQRARSFSAMAAFQPAGKNLTGDGEPERLAAEDVTASYFQTLGVMPAMGRPFAPDENRDGRDDVVVISHGLWQRRFGGDTGILARTVRLDNRVYRVVGVMPAGFQAPSDARGPDPVDVLAPLVVPPEVLTNRQDHEVDVIGRLAPGVSLETARAEMTAISESLAREFPTTADTRSALAPLGADQARLVRPLLLVLLGAVALVLVLACANVASLLVVRSISRQREIAIRVALGATRRRVMSELVTQSLVLAFAGAAVGLVIALWTKDTLVSFAPASLPHLSRVALDARVLAFTICLATLTGVVFGILPAWQVSRTRPTEVLRTTDRSVIGGWAIKSRQGLMVVEIALSTLLLIGAGLMLRSLIVLNRVPLGFEPDGVLAANIALPPSRYETPQSKLEFFENLAARLAAVPGVQSVAFANRLPLRGAWSSGFSLEPLAGQPGTKPQVVVGFQSVSPGYFDVLRMRLLRGRLLAAADRTGALPVAVVSEAFGRMVLGGAEPIGRRLHRGPNMPWITIVGVVADVRRYGGLSPVEPQVYLSAAQTEVYPLPLSELAVRAEREPVALAPAIKAAVWAIDGNQPVVNIRTLDETLSLRLRERQFQTLLFTLFAALALALAIVGVYGVVAYAVSQRTAEIGLRLALGASAARIVRWILAQSLTFVATGAAIGLAAAVWLSRYVRALLFEISPTDLTTYAAAALVLMTAALLASYLAARRAV
ncbi:MAG: ADOP family duplicated permease, partial [Acidobacteriota bacterium]